LDERCAIDAMAWRGWSEWGTCRQQAHHTVSGLQEWHQYAAVIRAYHGGDTGVSSTAAGLGKRGSDETIV
jgi:hypothetical protein